MVINRPIIFSAPMVRALIDGRKTQTRLVLKPQPDPGQFFSHMTYVEAQSLLICRSATGMRQDIRLPYAPGDRLWGREVWGLDISDHGDCPRYKATLDYQCGDKIKSPHEGPFTWRSPIHMPRRFSRLTLVVTDVRVQRLQEISEADAKAEGVDGVCWEDWRDYGGPSSYRLPFRSLWNSIHGHDAWDDNPWVAALTFTVHRCNIDQMDRDVQREEGTW